MPGFPPVVLTEEEKKLAERLQAAPKTPVRSADQKPSVPDAPRRPVVEPASPDSSETPEEPVPTIPMSYQSPSLWTCSACLEPFAVGQQDPATNLLAPVTTSPFCGLCLVKFWRAELRPPVHPVTRDPIDPVCYNQVVSRYQGSELSVLLPLVTNDAFSAFIHRGPGASTLHRRGINAFTW
jgi:hypothetical protein